MRRDATDADKHLWRMAEHVEGGRAGADSGCNEGVSVSTSEQRKIFIRKYGIEMLWALMQPLAQAHKCCAYCCKPTRKKVVMEGGVTEWVTVSGMCRFNYHRVHGYGRNLRPHMKRDPKLVATFQPARNDKRLTECDPKKGVATLANSNERACFNISGLVYYTIGYMCKQGRSSADFKEVMALIKTTDFANTSRSALGMIT